MLSSVSQRVRKRRDAQRASGLRPLQIWVPDARQPGFDEECRRQSLLVTKADALDDGLRDFMDAGLTDLDDDKE